MQKFLKASNGTVLISCIEAHPASRIQLILHSGANVLERPVKRIISDPSNLLEWKTNDRAVIIFKKPEETKNQTDVVLSIVKAWIKASA